MIVHIFCLDEMFQYPPQEYQQALYSMLMRLSMAAQDEACHSMCAIIKSMVCFERVGCIELDLCMLSLQAVKFASLVLRTYLKYLMQIPQNLRTRYCCTYGYLPQQCKCFHIFIVVQKNK